MELTLDNFTSLLSKELLAATRKTTVRECDEVAPGSFVAYVDEAADTYDVTLGLDDRRVAAHGCDCGSTAAFCRHKAALLRHLAAGARTRADLRTKKRDKSASLLDTVPAEDLRSWVLEMIQKNRELALAFTHRFAPGQHQYSVAEVKRLTNDVVKAVSGLKKHIDAAALRRIIDLWQEVHAPIVKSYLADVAEEASFENLHALVDSCLGLHWKTAVSSTRVLAYTDGILQQAVTAISLLGDEPAWDRAAGFFVRHIPDGKYGLRLHYLTHLGSLLALGSIDRQKRLVGLLAEQYRQSQHEYLHNGSKYTQLVFDLLDAAGMLNEHAALIKPIRFDHTFNQRLIAALVQAGQLELAAQYCRQQLQGSGRDEYNLPYLELLRDVYTRQGNSEALAEVMTQLLPRTYDFDDFLFVYNRITDDAQRKLWRNQMMVKAKTGSGSHNPQATAFVFRLLDYEGAYRKMIDNITYGTPYEVLCRYFQPMYDTDAGLLLAALLRKTDSWSIGLWYEAVQADRAFLPQLADEVLAHYSITQLQSWIQQADGRHLSGRNFAVLHAVRERLQHSC